MTIFHPPEARRLSGEIATRMRALPVKNTPIMRAALREQARELAQAPAEYVLEVARGLLRAGEDYRWLAYELLAGHRAAFGLVGPAELEEFGQGIHSWEGADSFARTLSGLAWRKGQVGDELILGWAASPDHWWRRTALVSTVVFNMRSQGGKGDTPRTLAVCRILAGDPDDMVVKGLSWVLRELIWHDAPAVRAFLAEYNEMLAARVKREVRSKLETGYKNPKGSIHPAKSP